MEIWKPVKGYEGLYEVSNQGNVRSVHYKGTNTAKTLVLKANNSGRLYVGLYLNGRPKYFLVHRLVAMAFVPNPNAYPEINHIDENPMNNNVENLEWCTRKQNVRYYNDNHPDHYRKRGCRVHGKHKGKRIIQVSCDGRVVKEWENSREIFIETGMSDWSISECCRGNRKTAYGYKWQYVI